MVLLFENGFSGWGQFLQSFCRSTREYVISLVALPLVIWQIHLCSCKSFAKIVPVPKNYKWHKMMQIQIMILRYTYDTKWNNHINFCHSNNHVRTCTKLWYDEILWNLGKQQTKCLTTNPWTTLTIKRSKICEIDGSY